MAEITPIKSPRDQSSRKPGGVLVFSFGDDLKRLLAAVAHLRAGRHAVTVIDLAYTGELQGEYAYLGARHISEWWEAPRVQQARELAAEWMESIPHRRLAISGQSFLETLTSNGTPLWWLFEISLQERAYLAVRLAEAVKAVIASRPATHYAVVGSHSTYEWKGELIAATCAAAGLAEQRLPGDLPSGTAPAVSEQTGQPRRWREVGAMHRLWVGEAAARKILAVIGAGFVGGIGTLLAVAALALAVPLWLARWIFRLGRPGAGLARTYLDLLRTRPTTFGRADLMVAVVAAAGVAAVVLTWPRWELPALVVASVAVAAGVVMALLVLVAPVGLGARAQIAWPIRLARATLGQRRRLARATLGLVRRRRLEPTPGVAEASVLVLVDEGNVRRRLDLTRRRATEYIPYLEGVIEALRTKADRLVVVSYGDPRKRAAGLMGKLQRARSAIGRRDRIPISAQLGERVLVRADQLRARRRSEWEVFAFDRGLQAGFKYQGIDFWPVFSSELEWLFPDTAYSEAYQEAFGRILDAVRPSVVVTYNYEGVFRRLLPAVIARGIPTLGVQQALGPYVHALKHDRAGYDRPLSRRPGSVPSPDRVAVWGERDVALMTSYGVDRARLTVAGYPRTDTYVHEAGQVDRQAVLRALGIKDQEARVVAFTAVRRVLGTGLMRDDKWVATLRKLVEMTASDPHLWVMVKPWGGDDLDSIRRVLDRFGNERVVLADPDSEIHNVELLAVVQAVVGTFSSLFAEALIMGAVPILLDYPETRYYFGAEVVSYATISIRATDPDEAIAAARRILDEPGFADRFRAAALPALRPLFGPLDGKAAERVAAAALELAHQPMATDGTHAEPQAAALAPPSTTG